MKIEEIKRLKAEIQQQIQCDLTVVLRNQIQQLQAVCEAAKEVDIDVLKKLVNLSGADYASLCNLQQALAKEKK